MRMWSFEALLEELLRKKPELSREAILRLVEEKKGKVGAGYLTDQGALFLVASDLGITLDRTTTSLAIKDLHVGANEVTVVGRIFAIYPLREYVRKDGNQGCYRRLILFDSDMFVKLTLWEDKAKLVDKMGLQPNDVVKVVKGYVKSDLDSRPTLHVGARGNLEPVLDDVGIPTIDEKTKDVAEVRGPEGYLSVKGVLTSSPKVSYYTRRDGSSSRVVQLYLRSLSTGDEVRVAVWDNESASIEEAQVGSTVRLVNLRSRPLPHGGLELHGDEATFLEVISAAPSLAQTRVFRLLSIGPAQEDKGGQPSAVALVTDKSGNLFTLIARGGAAMSLRSIGLEGMFECEPRALGSSTLLCDSDTSIQEKEEDEKYPKSSHFTYKVKELKDVTTQVFVKVIALSKALVQDILTKDGSMVRKAEVVVGDETGEVKLVAWRDLTSSLDEVLPGQRLFLRGVVVQKGREGSPVLQMRSYSSIDKL